jgi:hypothetical protein
LQPDARCSAANGWTSTQLNKYHKYISLQHSPQQNPQYTLPFWI